MRTTTNDNMTDWVDPARMIKCSTSTVDRGATGAEVYYLINKKAFDAMKQFIEDIVEATKEAVHGR